MNILKEKVVDKKKASETIGILANNVGKVTTDITNKTKGAVLKSQEAIINAIDENGNGQIDIEDDKGDICRIF